LNEARFYLYISVWGMIHHRPDERMLLAHFSGYREFLRCFKHLMGWNLKKANNPVAHIKHSLGWLMWAGSRRWLLTH